MNLPLLSRILAQPWAVRREHLATLTQLVIGTGALAPKSDTSWNVRQWDWQKDQVVTEPIKTTAGYTVLNYEGLSADQRGTLPEAPANCTVLLAWGVLGRAWSGGDRWWLDAIDVDEITAAVDAAPDGSTVVLWFRSPGGIITGIPETAEAMRKASRKKRLLAFTDDLCASAAYWLASQCESIHATPTAAVGSIGVYIAFYDFCAYLEKAGIKLELFKAGTMKAMGLPGKPLSDEEGAHLQSAVDGGYRQFTKDVLRNRDIAKETMQGQCLDGDNAKTANLVDTFWPSAAAFFAALGKGKV
ncbi:MAG: S49 family peptidase [Chthoniobacteraceae bacterium]